MLGWLLIVLALLAAAFVALGGAGEGGPGLDAGKIIYIAGMGALVLLYLWTLAGDYRGRASQALAHAAIWVGLALLLLTGYAFRGEIRTAFYRVAGEVLPPGHGLEEPDAAAGERSVRMRRQSSGHFVARAEVNGQTMSLLVDTGASTVVLKATDAARAGIDTSSLSFTVPVDTANGATFAAPARVARIAIGPIVLEGVEALVAKPGTLKESLLGMSFLRRLRSYEFSGDFLTIRG